MPLLRTPLRALAALSGAIALVVAALGVAPAAHANHTPTPHSVALVGSLQSELGCSSDWDPACAATELTEHDGLWSATFTVPAGDFEWKVALNDTWDESYGAGNGNMPLPLEQPTRLSFTYDHATHRLAVVPADAPAPVGPADQALATDSLRAALTRERMYFVMADRFENGDPSNDRAGLGDDRLVSGFDPTATGFYHGGDLQGVLDRLDYIQGLGTTAIWLTPSFKNKPVQGDPGSESAGYHGYWITDFTKIDPHLGTNAQMKQLVDAAHARGIKVFFDIITNHTADVIGYDRGSYNSAGELPYVSTAKQPYKDAAGQPFDDRDYADGSKPFPAVDQDSFPYKPIVPAAEKDLKRPAWLNDPTLYHNRGTSTFSGESNTYGDFPSGSYSALDDLWTENPKVVHGMEDIYQQWVTDTGIDGFRIDTVKHVNTEFWQQFSPALRQHAAALGNKRFFMFGEVYDTNPAFVSTYTTEGKLQATVDFGFQSHAVDFANGGKTSGLSGFYADDDWFTDTDSNAYELPTFLGNHDMGRVGSFLRQKGGTDAELLRRDELAHDLMYLTRGQPVVYYGDEQGFSAPPDVPGGIGDQRAREDMFPSKVELYNSYDLIGTSATTAQSNFDPSHPLYRHIAELAKLRAKYPALADGAQVTRLSSDGAGVFAFSRVDAQRKQEYVVALNNTASPKTASFDTDTPNSGWKRLYATGATPTQLTSDGTGGVRVTVPATGAVVYQARQPIPDDHAKPTVTFRSPTAGGDENGRTEVGVDVGSQSFTQVSFAWRKVGATRWQPLGTDDNAPYRVFHDVSKLPLGTALEYRAVVKDADGDLAAAQTSAMVAAPRTGGPTWGGAVTQPDSVSVPGTLDSEAGCAADWSPKCAEVQMSLNAQDGVWTKTLDLPQGTYAFKVAVNPLAADNTDGWKENYGLHAAKDGPNIGLDAPGGPVTFYYSHATHWITNNVETPHLYTATGSFQSELGCSADDDPACLRSWLQDPDGDGTWELRSHTLPPGTYTFRIAQDRTASGGTWGQGGDPNGQDVSFTLAQGQGVSITFRPPTPSDPGQTAAALDVSTYAAPTG